MANSINPTPTNNPQISYPKGQVDVGYMLQDSTVDGAHEDTLKLNLNGESKPASDDYALTVDVTPSKNNDYVLDPKAQPKDFLAMTILANLQRGLDIFKGYCDNVPTTWATGGQKLDIYPDQGRDFNAFYNREEEQGIKPGVHFFHARDPKTHEMIYSGSSGEVTCHEGGPGHAFLDRLRPGYFSTWSPDPAAFHESFGDVSALLTMLKDPGIVDKVVEQTGGDLTKHNVVSDLGEQLGSAINDYVEAQGGPPNFTGGNFVRTAINDFKWQDPSTLPDQPSNSSQMSSEPHDWSRLWTGSVYEILGKMVQQNMAGGQDAKTAINNADEDLLKIYGKMVSKTSPEGDFSYKDMANAMLAADSQATDGKWSSLIRDVMTERLILPASNSMSMDQEEPSVPQGTYKVKADFSGKEKAFSGTGLDALGPFSVETLQSGSENLFKSVEAQQGVTSKLQGDIARAARQGKILFTTPDQKLTDKDYINPKTREPYMGVVKWVDGQAVLHRLAMA